GLLGVAAIDDHDPLVEVGFHPRPQPAQLGGGQLQLGAERPAVGAGQPGHVLLPDVQAGLQRQGDGAARGVVGQGGQADPDVAVDELLAGRPGGGVVVGAGAFDAGAVAGGGAVVLGQQQAARARQAGADGLPGGQGHLLGAAADGVDGVVGGAERVGDAGGAEPGGGGAPAVGEEDAAQQQGAGGGRGGAQSG